MVGGIWLISLGNLEGYIGGVASSGALLVRRTEMGLIRLCRFHVSLYARL